MVVVDVMTGDVTAGLAVVVVVVAAGVAAGCVVVVLEEVEELGAVVAAGAGSVEVLEVAGAAVVVDVAGAGAGAGEAAGAGAGVIVGQGGYIPPHNCANAEVESPAVKRTKKETLGKENSNMLQSPFQSKLEIGSNG